MSTEREQQIIEDVERAMSALSLAGTLFIIATFTAFPTFRKPINRLVAYASVGNICCNIATIISVSGIPERGGSLELCRFQGFFIQMFMPADSLWTLCMALNVYLTFFHNYNAIDLRNLELRYAAACYGIPFIPALIYLILDASTDKGIYGPAVLWCWVSSDWEWMRIAFFYGPVWVIIIIIVIIYVVTGRVIFKQRAALRAFSRSTTDPLPLIENPFTAVDPNGVTRVTKIEVTSEAIQSFDNYKPEETSSRSSFGSTRKLSTGPGSTHFTQVTNQAPFQRFESNAHVWPYNAGAAQTGPDGPDGKNGFSASVSAGGQMPAELLMDFEGTRPGSSAKKASNGRTAHANHAAWGYAKVAFLMFVALFIVWVPSTVNRVYSLVYPEKANYALEVVAAAVLPLQGFWNFTIYVSTSWSQCRDAWHDTRADVRRWWRRHRRSDTTTIASARTSNTSNTAAASVRKTGVPGADVGAVVPLSRVATREAQHAQAQVYGRPSTSGRGGAAAAAAGAGGAAKMSLQDAMKMDPESALAAVKAEAVVEREMERQAEREREEEGGVEEMRIQPVEKGGGGGRQDSTFG